MEAELFCFNSVTGINKGSFGRRITHDCHIWHHSELWKQWVICPHMLIEVKCLRI